MKMVLSPRSGEWLIEGLQQKFPDVEFVHAKSQEEAVSLASDIDVSIDVSSRDFVEAAGNLRWIQKISAGVEGAPFDLLKERRILLTNAAANYGPNIADHALALMLMLARQIDVVRNRMRSEGWNCEKPIPNPGELAGQTLLIVGLGGIGMETARRAAAFGMRVIGTRRHADRPTPAFVDSVHPPEALHDLLPQADWVAVCAPLTRETRDLIHNKEFDLMKQGVHIVGVAREYVINLDALVRALDSGKVAGAGLDVLDKEAHALDHPIWNRENVIITPHASGHSMAAFLRVRELIKENVRRYLADEQLQNVVDLDAEY